MAGLLTAAIEEAIGVGAGTSLAGAGASLPRDHAGMIISEGDRVFDSLTEDQKAAYYGQAETYRKLNVRLENLIVPLRPMLGFQGSLVEGNPLPAMPATWLALAIAASISTATDAGHTEVRGKEQDPPDDECANLNNSHVEPWPVAEPLMHKYTDRHVSEAVCRWLENPGSEIIATGHNNSGRFGGVYFVSTSSLPPSLQASLHNTGLPERSTIALKVFREESYTLENEVVAQERGFQLISSLMRTNPDAEVALVPEVYKWGKGVHLSQVGVNRVAKELGIEPSSLHDGINFILMEAVFVDRVSDTHTKLVPQAVRASYEYLAKNRVRLSVDGYYYNQLGSPSGRYYIVDFGRASLY